MKNKTIKNLQISIVFFCAALSSSLLPTNRSILRPDANLPQITTYWQDDPTNKFTLKDSHIEEGPIFRPFDKTFFYNHMLPTSSITFRREPEKSVAGQQLNELIEGVLKELAEHKKKFAHFTVLKDDDYSYANNTGALVLKFKEYPFVLKIFSETPKNFVSPFSKGMEPGFFFVMGGGIMRHLTGFTRIKNMEELTGMIQQDPFWSKIVEFPRKWYWLPKDPRWLVVEGKNMGKDSVRPECFAKQNVSKDANGNEKITTIPALYAIVADCIKAQDRSWFDFVNSQRCMRLSQFTHYRIDPHLQNFMVEEGTGKIVIIDTENFRALVGLKNRFVVDSYFDWYKGLTKKCVKDRFFRSKRDRKNAQLAEWDVYTS